MNREDCYVGMPVSFGRSRGEQTQGKIVKLNDKKCKVVTTEQRGKSPAGAEWGVPYSMLTPLDPKDVVVSVPVVRELKYNPFSSDNLILEAILGVYSGLSPENLSCDGEASYAHIVQKRSELNRKLKGLQAALGYTVDESQIYAWYDGKRAWDNEMGICPIDVLSFK